jgi:hypothetical protein
VVKGSPPTAVRRNHIPRAKKVSPLIEEALVVALTSAVLRELRKDERPERVVIAAGRDVRGDEDRERDEFHSTP